MIIYMCTREHPVIHNGTCSSLLSTSGSPKSVINDTRSGTISLTRAAPSRNTSPEFIAVASRCSRGKMTPLIYHFIYLISAVRHHSQLDAKALARAIRVIGGDMTGVEFIKAMGKDAEVRLAEGKEREVSETTTWQWVRMVVAVRPLSHRHCQYIGSPRS